MSRNRSGMALKERIKRLIPHIQRLRTSEAFFIIGDRKEVYDNEEKRHKIIVLNEGVEFQPVSSTAAELQMRGYRYWNNATDASGFSALPYNGKMDSTEKIANQNAFIKFMYY